MQVFELHFNPKAKKDVIFDTFYYEPENIYEERLGHLFLAGELVNALPQNERFLKNLARAIKTKFYSFKTNRPETCLKKSLQEGNSFLEKVAKEGDVSWISNLNFAILNLCPKRESGRETRSRRGYGGQGKKYKLNFTRVGDIEIFLTRAGKVLDVGQNLKTEEIEPYPLKVFFNIASGRLEQGDRILVMSKQVSDSFFSQDIVEKIAQSPFLDEKSFNKTLANVKKDILGMCFLITLQPSKEKELERRLVFKEKVLEKRLKKFSKKIKAPALPRISLPSSLPCPKFFETFLSKIAEFGRPTSLLKKNIALVLSLIFLLFLGGVFARIEENRKNAQIQIVLEAIQEKLEMADSLLILDQRAKANDLFLQAFEEIQPLTRVGGLLESDISRMAEILTAKLFDLNKLAILETPELIFEFKKTQFLPQKLIYSNQKIYFFSPYSENVFELKKDGKTRLLEIPAKFSGSTDLPQVDTVLFFSKPNSIWALKNGNFSQPFSLQPGFEEFGFDSLSAFKSNLYFLDQKTGEIVKYPYLGDLQWGDPQRWSTPTPQKVWGSIAVDGGIWILNQDNSIDRYYGGKFQKTLEEKIFPFPENFTKIWTSSALPYLYILEPEQQRIIILDKNGQIIKQYQSEEFDNLKDFAVSEDGKTIYLLNELKLYKVSF